jgi:hypothetical protein
LGKSRAPSAEVSLGVPLELLVSTKNEFGAKKDRQTSRRLWFAPLCHRFWTWYFLAKFHKGANLSDQRKLVHALINHCYKGILLYRATNIEMEESGGLSVQRVSETNSIVSDFIPPMSDSGDVEPPSKKRRQISLEPSPAALGDVAFVEPHVGSSESSNPVPASSPASASGSATTTQPDTSEDRNDRTSKDYYFDSYSHHAIRKLLVVD